jgi:hypothetical protein
VSTYTTTSFALSHSLTVSLDGIVAGRVYSFSTRAVNAKGSSGFSNALQAGVTGLPTTPTAPAVDRARSGLDSLFITWTANTDDPTLSPGGDIVGYQLLMATPESGDAFSVVLDTVLRSTQVTEFLVSSPTYSLTTGANYQFKVIAHNFNGPSAASPVSTFRVCGDPSGLAQPFRVTATTTPTPSLTVGW